MQVAQGLMCVHAHPDDESITTGGVLARAAEAGIRTAVVTCTGGELGEIVGAGMDADEVRPRLAEVRAAELAEALEILGVHEGHSLGYRDSGMVGDPGNDDPRAFWQAPMDEAVGRLVAHIREFRPAVLVCYDAFGGYGHPDHVQAHRVTMLAADAAAIGALYPEAGRSWRVAKVYQATWPKSEIARFSEALLARGLPSPFGDTTDPDEIPMGLPADWITTRVDVRPWIDRKMRALRAHYSQLAAESFFLNMPDELVSEVFGTEWFALARGQARGSEDDLFAGLGSGPGVRIAE